jgi:hypothetical protein
MSALGQKRTCGKLRSVTWFAKACAQLSGPAYVEASYEVGDGMETVTCHCGAMAPPRTKAHLNASLARKNYPHGPMCNFVLGSSLNRIESDALGFKAREQFAGHFDSDYL